MTKYSINRFFFPPEDMIKGQLLSKGQEKKKKGTRHIYTLENTTFVKCFQIVSFFSTTSCQKFSLC